MADWQQTYDPRDLNYLSARAKQIRDIAALFGVPAPGLAGGIAREMAYNRGVYAYDPFLIASSPLKDVLTSYEPVSSSEWRPISHDGWVDHLNRSNSPGGYIKTPFPEKIERGINKFSNPVFWDVGPGNINIRTAIGMLQNYN